MEVTREECCCDGMYNAILLQSKNPINIKMYRDVNRKFSRFDLEFVDTYNPEEFALWEGIAEDSISFCPFCGKQVDPCELDLSKEWKTREYICEDFLEWFMKGRRYPNVKAPTPMFKYEASENQFYMHYRKGFGEGWIPITYCIYCGEPLSEMIEKYGIPKVISDRLNHFE
jgi:hypothetical protein